MDYCTIEDIETHLSIPILVQLTSDDGQEDVDRVVAQEAIIYSSVLINGYLRGRYSLPLDTRFPLLKIIAVDISIYRLYSRRMRTEIPEIILQQYNDAIKMLQNIQKGVITLEAEGDTSLIPDKLQSGNYKSNKTELDRLFNKGVFREY